jgi:hypothetical protein
MLLGLLFLAKWQILAPTKIHASSMTFIGSLSFHRVLHDLLATKWQRETKGERVGLQLNLNGIL